ncbi:endothelial monocyte-activating polypeptide 2 precursor [Gracilaria domingensis]|nr:endothelial monocyte-activating polypeptide 2 precursor [Gracilaria domingensis]
MSNAGFIASTATALWRSSAGKISTEAVGERMVSLVWSGRPSSAFTVLYAPSGAKFRSRRIVAHPRVNLTGLKPGVPYDVHVTGNGFDASTSFTTVATAQSPSAVDKDGGSTELPLTEISRLEIRVGKIVECEKHPEADSLYVEKIDVGEEEPRTIVSGLVKYVPLDKMIGRTVVVLCNLKPRAMRGITSHGMLLCASNEDHTIVDPLSAPPEAPIGELITFDGHKSAPIDPSNRATKAFDRITDGLKTSTDGVAMFEDVPFSTSAGACFSPEKLVGPIS